MISWLIATFQQWPVDFSYMSITLKMTFLHPFCMVKEAYDSIGPTRRIYISLSPSQDQLISSLIPSANLISLCHILKHIHTYLSAVIHLSQRCLSTSPVLFLFLVILWENVKNRDNSVMNAQLQQLSILTNLVHSLIFYSLISLF